MRLAEHICERHRVRPYLAFNHIGDTKFRDDTLLNLINDHETALAMRQVEDAELDDDGHEI
jgi:hypothetical protein